MPTFQVGKMPMPLVHQEESVATMDPARSGVGSMPPYTSEGLSWAFDEPHVVPTAGFGRREEPIAPIHFAGARYLGVQYDKKNGKKDVGCPRLVIQTTDGTFLLERKEQHRRSGDPMALRQPFGISVQRIWMRDANDLAAYRSFGGFVPRFLSDQELRDLDPLVRGKSDAAFHFQLITADAIVAERRRLDKQAEHIKQDEDA